MMYTTKSTTQHRLEVASFVVIPPLFFLGALFVIFNLPVQGLPTDAPLPWAFIWTVVGIALFCGVGTAITAWVEGPGMRPMTRTEEAAVKARIRNEATQREWDKAHAETPWV